MSEFDIKAATWDDDPKKVHRAKKIGSILRNYFKDSQFKKGLEYGSGTGLLGFELSTMIDELTMMDQSLEMIKVASYKANKHDQSLVKAIQYDLLTEKLPTERFDFIFTLLTMHHIRDIGAILEKYHDLLSDEGVLAIIDLEKEDGSFHEYDFDGHLGFDKIKLENQLKANNLVPFDYFVIYSITKDLPDGSKKDYPLFLSLSKKNNKD